jgi:hypothetical protein
MHSRWLWITRIHPVLAFIVLFAGHLLLYYSLGTPNWLVIALSAAFFDTAVWAVLQLVVQRYARSRNK